MRKTIVLGASPRKSRMSYRTIERLVRAGIEVIPIGIYPGTIAGVPIRTQADLMPDVDTVTVYLNRSKQMAYYPYIVELNPGRVLFNPGAENPEFEAILGRAGIPFNRTCTLTLLSLGSF
jgi:predicted CoA-binding protein